MLSQTYAKTPVIKFTRGKYNEIFPPMLVQHITEQEAIKRLVDDNAKIGNVLKLPKFGFSFGGTVVHALQYAHHMHLREVLAGECEDIVESELYEAVTGRGEPLSLRPVGLEERYFDAFAPVLRCLTPRNLNSAGRSASGGNAGHSAERSASGVLKWQVGVKDHGRVEILKESDPAKAVAEAQRFYADWAALDDEDFDSQIQAVLAVLPPSVMHDFWHAEMARDELWEYGGGFAIRPRGNHRVLELYLPEGLRVIETDFLRAVRLADGLARKAGVRADYPTPAEFHDWLTEQDTPQVSAVAWDAKDPLGLTAKFKTADGKEIHLVKRSAMVAAMLSEKGTYTTKLAETALTEPLTSWLKSGDAAARTVLARWVLWKVAQAAKPKTPAPNHTHDHDDSAERSASGDEGHSAAQSASGTH